MAEGSKPPARIWPGAVELGLQRMPAVSPIACSLAEPDAQTWMNQLAAEREKGAPLSAAERRRIHRGKSWMPLWRLRQERERRERT